MAFARPVRPHRLPQLPCQTQKPRHPLCACRRPYSTQSQYTPAPKVNSGPLLSRIPNRQLPALSRINNPWYVWRHLPLVVLALGGGALGIINYEKTNHSVVGSSLYALRVHPVSRELLGDEIYFTHAFPWISGPIDPMHGVVDVQFDVKGTTGSGRMHFKCTRAKRRDFFKVEAWTLTMADGRIINLQEAEGAVSPMMQSELRLESA